MISRFPTRLLAACHVVALVLVAGTATATDLAGEPSGPVLLEVSGSLDGLAPDTGSARLDRSMLEGLGVHEVRTTSDWTDGQRTFAGPLVRDLLAALEARGDRVVATAHNDYAVEIPASDFETYPVILALTMDGEPLTLRDKGPIWIVYPRDDFPALRDPAINARWIWQLRSLEVR